MYGVVLQTLSAGAKVLWKGRMS